jgi:hypothetical protein
MPHAAGTGIDGLIGVYRANGGAVGELRYVIGKFLGTAHCALCDVTHSPVRRNPAWDAMAARLGHPFTLLHLNELTPDIAAAVDAHGSPVVLARSGDGRLDCLLGPADLDSLNGSVSGFEDALREALALLPG